jgi:hypothetical protein
VDRSAQVLRYRELRCLRDVRNALRYQAHQPAHVASAATGSSESTILSNSSFEVTWAPEAYGFGLDHRGSNPPRQLGTGHLRELHTRGISHKAELRRRVGAGLDTGVPHATGKFRDGAKRDIGVTATVFGVHFWD